MPPPDYASILDVVPGTSPSDLVGLLRRAAAPLGCSDLTVYLVDFQGAALQPVLLDPASPVVADEDVEVSVAGRVFRTGEPVVTERADGARVWVPLVERAERTGVVALTVPSADGPTLTECRRLGVFAGLLVRGFARTTDLLHLCRRRRSMTLAAGMQWDLLPPLTVRSSGAMACGRLEPAYEIAGDAFDYALNDTHLHAAVFDGMGHGVESTLMTTLAVGAYRHARRKGLHLEEVRATVDEALAGHYGGQAFVTAAFARLEVATGALEWVNSGHPRPLLLRDRRVVRQLACAPSLPLGLQGACVEVALEPLEPGDCVLFFTDGVVEGRSHTGEEFGVDRLATAWERHASTDQQADEVLRRLVEEVTTYNAGKLRDDASLMLVSWNRAG